MTYDDYILVHRTERENADGCDLCKYEDRQPWEFPCIVCKRNCMDLYEHMEYVELRRETLTDRIKRGLKEMRPNLEWIEEWKEKR